MKNNHFVVIDFDPKIAPKYASEGYNMVVVDVLRATSTIVVAIAQGASEVIPCLEIDEAKNYKKTHSAIIIGEREGQIVPGFDFTNSPYDLSKADIENRIVAITTTTGTKLIAMSLGSPNILIGSTLNTDAVAKRMKQLGGRWALIGAGTHGKIQVEDEVGCAVLAHSYINLTQAGTNPESKKVIDKYAQDEKKHILNSLSARMLSQMGRKVDVDFVISNSNKYKIAPIVTPCTNQGKKVISITA